MSHPPATLDKKLTHFRKSKEVSLFLTGTNLGRVESVMIRDTKAGKDWTTRLVAGAGETTDTIVHVKTTPAMARKIKDDDRKGSSDLQITLTFLGNDPAPVTTNVAGVEVYD